MTKFLTAISLGFFSCCLMSGCAETKPASDFGAELDHSDHDHDHDHGHADHDHGDHDHGDHDHGDHDHGDHDHSDHDHGDVHGPFGGHVFSFDSDDYRAEWKHYNDNDVIEVYVLDPTGKNAAPVNATVTMTPLAGADKTPFELEAKEPNEEGESAIYSIDDKDLTITITAAGVKVGMKIGDKTYEGVIEAHAPHDH